jgi:hypothetical protein
MVHLSKPNINADGNILTSAGFTLHETIYFWSLVFITDHFASMSLSPKGSDSDVIFVGMLHNGSPSLLAILEDSSNEGDTASSRGRSSSSPDPQGCNVVTPTIPITTTPLSEGTSVPLTIPTVPLQIIVPQSGPVLLHEQHQDYQEEKQVRAGARQVDAKRRAVQRRGELTGERATINDQLTKLHHYKSALKTKQAIMADLTNL